MKTLGIDLASQPARTAACEISWRSNKATVSEPTLGLDDGALLEQIAIADKVGIDAPFGWPERFVEAIVSHREARRWPSTALPELRYRLTDRIVLERARQPLSVSSDRIAVAAMRCARLLSTLAERSESVDRSGFGKVVEVYPAAALVVWGFDSRGYKRLVGREKRGQLIEQLRGATAGWLEWSPEVDKRCIAHDDCLDALIAALIARAAALRLTVQPTEGELAVARREGWIHLPETDSLDQLRSG